MCCSLSSCFFPGDFLSRILINLSQCMLHILSICLLIPSSWTQLYKKNNPSFLLYFVAMMTCQLVTQITLNCLIGIATRVGVQWGAALSWWVSPLWCVMGSCGGAWGRPNPVGARPCCEPLHGLWHRVLAWQTKASLQVTIHKIQEARKSQDKVKAPPSDSFGTTCP
jgi:hypothetical protein